MLVALDLTIHEKYFLYEIFRTIPEENTQQKTPLAFTKDVTFTID